MSFNVGWDSIFPDGDPLNDEWRSDSKPAEFGRIVKAVAPDVVCLQEISPRRDPQQVGEILNASLPLGDGKTWHAHSGRDNVIAARFELLMPAEGAAGRALSSGRGHAMALVDLPDADYPVDLYLVCAHFKSKGGQANIEARQRQADVIIEWIGDIKTAGGEIDLPAGTPMIVLGDLNVYDTDPGDAMPRHNATGEELYTWRDDTQAFNPGLLDRILFTDTVISLDHAFVLNTTIMTEDELAAAGLGAGDVMLDPQTGRYDHLPLVIDIAFPQNQQ